jgi:hypothetical protein
MQCILRVLCVVCPACVREGGGGAPPPPVVCHSPILLIHVSTRPQSGRIAVVWPPGAVASVVAARAAGGRAGGYVGYFREVRGSGRRGPASGAHGPLIPAEGLGARNRDSVGRNARLGADLVWGPVCSSAQRAQTDPPGIRPQQASSPPGVISTPPECFWGYLSASYARLEPILGPCAMTGPRAMRGAERAHDPRHLQTRRNLTCPCRRPYATLGHALRVLVG